MNPLINIYSAAFNNGGWWLASVLRGGGSNQVLKDLRRRETLRTEARQHDLDQRIKAIIQSAAHAPYYAAVFKEKGIDPEAPGMGAELLRRIPVLTKDDLRSCPQAFISSRFKGTPNRIQTAGSTGQPLRAFLDPVASATCTAGMQYGRSWWGIRPGERALNLWGHSKYLSDSLAAKARLVKRHAYDALMNRRVFPAYELSPKQLDRFIATGKRFRPRYLVGYASALYAAAQHMLIRGETFEDLKGVVSTGEMLYDFQAQTLRDAFQCPVIREYGLCEGGVVAYEHPQGELYVMDGYVHVELLDRDDNPVTPGRVGRIVITPLLAHKVPMLRYDTGDLAKEVEQDDAGPTGRRIGTVQGRAYDLIVAEDGTRLPGVLFTHAMKYLEEVHRYQVVQRTVGQVEIFYEAAAPLDTTREALARARIQAALHRPVKITFQHRQKLAADKSGKFRWIKSELSPTACL